MSGLGVRAFGAALAGVLAAAGAGSLHAQGPAKPAGQAVFEAKCAMCHANAALRAPGVELLHALPESQVRFALTDGVMRQQGAALSADEKEQVIGWLAGAPGAVAAGAGGHGAAIPGLPNASTAASADWVEPLRCTGATAAVDTAAKPALPMAGVTLDNARKMTAAQSGLTNAQLSTLDVAWTLNFPKTAALRVTPVIVGSTLFYAVPQPAMLMAIDTRSGCIKWAKPSAAPYRASPAFGMAGKRPALFVADQLGMLRALDPKDGSEIWKTDPRHDTTATITGGPMVAGDRLIVPISVLDVARAADPGYGCCKAHGAVAAVDAATGKLLWTAHTMEDAKPLGRKSAKGVEFYGPSGAPIWSTPAVDLATRTVYAGTGENTSPPATKTSDSIMAIDLDTGKTKWVFQALEHDIWNMSCSGPKTSGPNCFFMDGGESILKDYDFGAGAIVAKRPGGGQLILAGQKSGAVWALDPAKKGAVVWTKRFGEGSALGGVHWGIASDGQRVFAPIADPTGAPSAVPGLHALDIATGKEAWSWAATPDCENGRGAKVMTCKARYGLSAAPLVVDKALVTGSLDGKVRVFDTATGKVLWTYDTIRDFPARTPGGAVGRGGAIDAQSISAGDGAVFVGSGYGQFNQQPGNVLIAFRPKAAIKTAAR